MAEAGLGFGRYVVLARAYRDPQAEQQQPQQQGRQQGKRPRQAKAGQQAAAAGVELVYSTPEAEANHALAAWSYCIPVEGRPEGEGDLQPVRLVMQLDAARCAEATRRLAALQVGA